MHATIPTTSSRRADAKGGLARQFSRSLPCLAALALGMTGASSAVSAANAPVGRVQSGNRIVFNGSLKEVAPDAASAKEHQAAITSASLDARELGGQINFEVALGMRQIHELHAQMSAGRTVSPVELDAKHLPLAADFNAVAAWLTSQGFTIVNRDAHRLAVFARGSVGQVQAAFDTRFARVSHEGKSYLSAVKSPSVPASLSAVSGVLGLQPFQHAHPFFHLPAGGPTPATNNQPPYLVKELLGAYNASTTTLTGAGQRIGIIIDVPPLNADLTAFWTANNINQSLSRISSEDTSLPGTTLDTTSGEETLDVSWSSGIAPQATVKVFAAGDLSFVNLDNTYSAVGAKLKAGTEPDLHQLSLSYGADEDALPSDQLSQDQAYFAAIASYGVTIFVSSGDNGAFDSNSNRSVSSPASDPSVTAVGGTSVVLDASTGAVTSETAWTSDGVGFSDGRIAASGGGISGYFPHPSWQVGSTVPTGFGRLVPDVASSADQNEPGYLVLTQGTTQLVGGYANGTSWASPTWAGLCALLNQGRANAGLTSLGLLNPKIYPLLGTSSFRDITTGDNQYPGYPGYGYDAKVGYDLVTGLGSPNFLNLLAALVKTPPKITSSLTASAKKGVAFSYQIVATNSPASYGASGLPSGLSISTSTGKISGTPTATGSFSVTIAAFNTAGSGSAKLALTVAQAAPVITSTLTASATTGKAFTYQIVATNSPASYGASGLPSGLSISTSAGKISGTPTKAGTYSVTIAAFNSGGSGSAKLTLTVKLGSPVVTSATTATGTVGKAFSYQIAATNSPSSYGASGLPAGLSISTSTGKISGTPTKAGTYSVTVAAFNATGSGSAKLTLTVAAR